MLHGPHNIGKYGKRAFQCEDLYLGHTARKILIGTAADDNAFAVFLGVDENIKGDRMEYARGGKDTNLSGKHTAKSDFFSLVGEKIKTKTSRFDENDARAFVAVVNIGSFLEIHLI